jgi:hypothetical protein
LIGRSVEFSIHRTPGENLPQQWKPRFDALDGEMDHASPVIAPRRIAMSILVDPATSSTHHEPSTRRSRASLFVAIQAVEVEMEVDGVAVCGVIPREVFEYCLDTRPMPDAWLTAFEDHRATFEEIIRRRYRASRSDFVVVRSHDMALLADLSG